MNTVLKEGNAWDNFTKFIGDTWTNISGVNSSRMWQEYMSGTSYQRAVQDLEAAGLNPAMLYQSGGQGASTPSGANVPGMPAMDIIGQTANFINSITNARKVDMITKSNELKKKQANQLYQTALDITKKMY